MINFPPRLTPTIDQIRHKSQQVHSNDVTATMVVKYLYILHGLH